MNMKKAPEWEERFNMGSARVGLKVKRKSTLESPFQNFISEGNYRVTDAAFELLLTCKVPRLLHEIGGVCTGRHMTFQGEKIKQRNAHLLDLAIAFPYRTSHLCF